MMCALPVPDHSIAGLMNGSSRKLGIVGLELLQTDHIGAGFSQPLEQSGKAAVYSVDVIRCDGERLRPRPTLAVKCIGLQIWELSRSPIRRATKKLVAPSLAHRPRWSEDFAGNGLGLRYAVDSVSKGREIAVGESERRGANIGTDHAHGIERYCIERRARGAE